MAFSAYDFLIGKKEEIRDHLTMAGTFPFRPTLFVGLGGTGSQAVAKEKELFLNLVSPSLKAGTDGRIPDINPLYAFRAFDTNGSETQATLAKGVEWHQLEAGALEDFYKFKGQTPFFEPWLVKRFPLTSLGAGCGGFRNLGRLALVSNISQVNQILINARTQITAAAAGIDVATPRPLIHIFCSLSGGTGSGMLLDMCFLLRRILPGVEIIGHIAVLDGLPGVTASQRRNIGVNTFCALKELNAFMSGKAPSMGETIHYSQSVQATACEPMNYCFLLSSYRNDGSSSLPAQAHLSSFMARTAFMISGYSFTPKDGTRTPDFAGVMVDVPRLAEVEGGAHACYVVPGFAQAHFPVGETAALFVLTKTRECLQYLRGGVAQEGDAEAAEFVGQNRLEMQQVKDVIGRNPAVTENPLLAPPTYNDILGELFQDPAGNRDQILALAGAIPSARLANIENTLRPNVDKLLNTTLQAVREAAALMFEKPDHLGLGALDFLSDLKTLVSGEFGRTHANVGDAVEPDYADLPRKWAALRVQVEDAVTNEGIIDRLRDWYNRHDVRDLYIEFLNRAEIILLEKARADLAMNFYTALSAEIASLSSALQQLVKSDVETAIQCLQKAEENLATSLCRQDNAEDSSVEHIRSFNVMTREWRKTYLEEKKLPPEAVLGYLLKAGWRPISMLDTRHEPGGDPGMEIAGGLVEKIEPLFTGERSWSPVQVLRETAKTARVKPADLIEKIYSTMLQPQMQIMGVTTRTGIDLDTLVFSGGIDREFSDELQTSGKFSNVTFNSAGNQERNRVNFTTVTLPIPLVGCNLVTDTLKPHYQSWLEDVMQEGSEDREQKLGLYHCFPGSATWSDPTGYSTGFDAAKVTFARALAFSEILEPSAADLEKMGKEEGGPKEKRYALFQVGESQFWLWPFFPPDDSSAPIPGTPRNLGKNVAAAFKSFSTDPDLVKYGAEWVQWMEDHWSDQHSSKEIRGLRDKALLAIAECKGRSGDLECVAFWDEVAAITRDWKIG